MRTRHKTPTLVSMWMLDVFCCALGCAVLLWTLESLRASLMTEEAAASQADYEKTDRQLRELQAAFDRTRKELNSDIDDLRGRLAAMTADRDAQRNDLIRANTELANTKSALALATSELTDATKKLTTANSNLTAIKDDLARAATRVQSLEEEMKKKEQSVLELNQNLARASQSELELQKLLRERLKEADTLNAKLKAAESQLADADAKYRALSKDAVDVAQARAKSQELQKQLDNANLTIIDLQGDRRKLADKIDKLRLESEAKFAGVALSGKQVAFLVDISGSMKLIDEKTPDPNKWPGVVETVGKVMRSIPDLDKVQVVIFSRNAKYLFGTADWIPYKGEETIKDVCTALLKTTVGGDTNMYEGFELCFKLRDTGLDTIYFFSDGLPTSGAGLTPEQDARLTESQRTEALARHIRVTLKNSWNRLTDSKRVRINSIGFFYESPEVGAFLWALSRENDGSFVGMSKP